MVDGTENQIDAEMKQGPPLDPAQASIDQEMNQAKFGTPVQQGITALEGVARGALSAPIAAAGEAVLSRAGVPGLSPAEQAGRQQANPWESGGTEALGLAGPAIASAGLSSAARAGLEIPEAITTGAKLLAENTQGGLLEKAGKAAEPIAAAMGIGGPGAGVLGKIGSGIVRGAVENGLFQAGDEASKLINGDPTESVQSAIPHVGGAALIGGLLGGGAGAISSLWKATYGAKTGELLNAIASRVGGIEGVAANPVTDLTSKLGFEVAPELQSAATNDPALREMASILGQSDTSNAGREFQKTMEQGRQKAAEVLAESLGIEAKSIPSDFDEYSRGSKSLNTLADEAKARMAPIRAGYDEAATKFSGRDLAESIAAKGSLESPETKALNTANKQLNEATNAALEAQKSGDVEASLEAAAKHGEARAAVYSAQRAINTPGTLDMLQEKVAQIASDMKLGLAPESAASKAVVSIQKDLTNPQFKTLADLSAYIKKIDEKIPFNPNDHEGMEVARKLKKVFRDTEGEVIGSHIGSEEGQEALDKYRETQQNFSREAGIKEELEARLGNLGPTSSYEKRIRELSTEKGEKGFRALNGKSNADTLRLLQEHFPKTAEAVRQSLVEKLLSKAKDGDTLSPRKIISGLEALTPQQRDLVIPAQYSDRISAITHFLDQIDDKTHNWSNTARTSEKLMQNLPGAAVGLVAMLLGHNPAVGLAIGALTKYIGKDAPDAMRLGLLKWMGSSKPVDAGAFKSMVDFIHSTMKGDSLMDHVTKSVFKAGSKTIPEHLIPSQSETNHLDNKLKAIKANPNALENIAPKTNYYMQNHAIAMTATAANVSNYLNNLRPNPIKLSPLDPEIEPSDAQKAQYQRTLNIAQQPLMVVHHLIGNTITSEDVNHLKTMYPGLYSKLSQKMTDAMIDHISKGNDVPYSTRQGLSVLLGQPMDSSLSSPSIMANQMAFSQDVQDQASKTQASQGKSSPSQVGMRGIKKDGRTSLDMSHNED